jgi:hypothetical protein
MESVIPDGSECPSWRKQNALIKQYNLVLEKRKKNEEETPDVPPST